MTCSSNAFFKPVWLIRNQFKMEKKIDLLFLIEVYIKKPKLQFHSLIK